MAEAFSPARDGASTAGSMIINQLAGLRRFGNLTAETGSHQTASSATESLSPLILSPENTNSPPAGPVCRFATDLIEWHMPLVPAAIVKRNAVMWNSRSSHRWHRNSFTHSADQRNLQSLAGFYPLS
jgi:hypothetical protein